MTSNGMSTQIKIDHTKLIGLHGRDLMIAFMSQLPQTEALTVHHFYPGLYIREITIPKGCFIIGKRHKQPTLNIMLKGKLAVTVDGVVQVLEAPYMYMSGRESKMAYAIEETVWQNIYPTDETNLDKLEEMFIDEPDIKSDQGERLCLGDM